MDDPLGVRGAERARRLDAELDGLGDRERPTSAIRAVRFTPSRNSIIR